MILHYIHRIASFQSLGILGLVLLLSACDNDYNARAGAGFQKANGSKTNAKGRTNNAQRTGTFFPSAGGFQGGGLQPDGGRTRTNQGNPMIGNPADSQPIPFDPSVLELDPQVQEDLDEAIQTIADNAEKAKADQEAINQGVVKMGSKVDTATLVPETSLAILKSHLRGQLNMEDGQAALSIDEVDAVLSSVNAFLQNLALKDLSQDEVRNQALADVRALKDLYQAMANQATGIEENKVVAKLQKQQGTLVGVESMLSSGATGEEIRQWVMAANAMPAGTTLPAISVPTKPKAQAQTIVEPVIPGAGEGDEAISLSANMNAIYCFLKGLQDGHDAQDKEDCRNQTHSNIELNQAMQKLLQDLNQGQDYAPSAAAAILKLNDQESKFMDENLSDSDRQTINAMDQAIAKKIPALDQALRTKGNASKVAAPATMEQKRQIFTNPNPTDADIAVMEELQTLEDDASTYLYEQAFNDTPQVVAQRQQEFLDRLETIDAKCATDCSDAQKPVFQQKRDALERSVALYDQPEAKKLADDMALLDPAAIDAQMMEQAHRRIGKLSTPALQADAAKRWSEKVAQARALNPDGIDPSQRKRIVENFDAQPADGQSIEAFLDEQEAKLDAEYGLPKKEEDKAAFIENQLTPEQQEAYKAERGPIEEARASLIEAQMDAAVQDEYAQAAFGDPTAQTEAADRVSQKKEQLKTKIEQLDPAYLATPEQKTQLMEQAEQDTQEQWEEMEAELAKPITTPTVSNVEAENQVTDEAAKDGPTHIDQAATPAKKLLADNATAADQGIMDDLSNLQEAVTSYYDHQAPTALPHEVALKKQEYLGMLEGIDARCEGNCSEAQKPLFQAQRDAVERDILFHDQPEAKQLTDQIAGLDPAQISPGIIEAAHQRIAALPSRDQREYAAQQWSEKLEQARALNPDGITQAERQAIVEDFDAPLSPGQSVDDYLDAQQEEINQAYGLSPDKATDWPAIIDGWTPAQKAAYNAEQQKVEDARGELYEAQMDAAVQDHYAMGTFGDIVQREQAKQAFEKAQAPLQDKVAKLDASYLSDPAKKAQLQTRADQSLDQQYRDLASKPAANDIDPSLAQSASAASDATADPAPTAIEQLSKYLEDPSVADASTWEGSAPLKEEDKRILAPFATEGQELETLDDAKTLVDGLPTQAQKDAGIDPELDEAKETKAQVQDLENMINGQPLDPERANDPIAPSVAEALNPQPGERNVETLGDAEKLIQERKQQQAQNATNDQRELAVDAQEKVGQALQEHKQDLPVRENRSEQKEYLQSVVDGKKPIKLLEGDMLNEPLDSEIKEDLQAHAAQDQELETVGDAVALIRDKQKTAKATEKNAQEDPDAAKKAQEELAALETTVEDIEEISTEDAQKEAVQNETLAAVAAGEIEPEQLTDQEKQAPLSDALKEELAPITPEGMPLETVGNAAEVIEKHQDVANGEEVYTEPEQPALSGQDQALLKALDILGSALDQTIAQRSAQPADTPNFTKEDVQTEVKKALDAQFAAQQLVEKAKLNGDMQGLKMYEKIDLIIAQKLQGKQWKDVTDYKPILQDILRAYADTLNPNVEYATSRYSYPGGASQVVELKLPAISQNAINMLQSGASPQAFSQKVEQDLNGLFHNTGIDYLVYTLKHYLKDHVSDNFLKKEIPMLLVKNSGMNNQNPEYLYLVSQYLDAAGRISLGSLPLTTTDAPQFDISIVFAIEQLNENP